MNSKTIITLMVLVLLAAVVFVGIKVGDGQATVPQQNQAEEENNNDATPPAKQEAIEKEPAEEPEKKGDPTKEWNLLLANKDNPLPEDFAPEVEPVQGNYQMDQRVAPAMKEMIAAAKEDGVDLLVCSAYRSIEKQTALFEEQVAQFVEQGMEEKAAEEKTATMIAVPGTSEHHTGLAADIVTPAHQTLDPQFAQTEAGKWLLQNAEEYGFVLRYPEDKQEITNIIYESWHYRYVGKEHAKVMNEKGMCLEEYLQFLKEE